MDDDSRQIRPDDVSDQFAEGSIRLRTKIIPVPEEKGASMFVIEGDSISLEYLGRLLQAQAHFDLDCGYGIDPSGAGNAFFTEDAKFGIYIHRLPCMDVDSETDSTPPGKTEQLNLTALLMHTRRVATVLWKHDYHDNADH